MVLEVMLGRQTIGLIVSSCLVYPMQARERLRGFGFFQED
uniref:Uncharacterized protein n=1 Tax=Physcomitrium patens TaxID=3218 RepID=A0A2K1KEG2_PHYPA|nr:hypothetical protein PHYPA_008538 [Physcomitrium patens]